MPKQINNASIAFFRIAFGLMMAFSSLRFISCGWVNELYGTPLFFFKYQGFEWIPVWNETGIYLHIGLLFVLSIAVACGYYYRVSIIAFFLLFTWFELMAKSYYLNHYHFISLMAFLMCFIPAHQRFSLDVLYGRTQEKFEMDAHYLWVLRVQVAIVYVCAGIAKLHGDWLILAQPLQIWLRAKSDFPLIGNLFNFTETAYLFSWFSAIYDLTIPFFLLWNKSRVYAYGAVVLFHLMTWLLFPIGMFPWIMIVTALLFFPSDFANGLFQKTKRSIFRNAHRKADSSVLRIWFFGVFIIVQLILPFRYLLYEGSVLWYEEGFRFSWRVMLIEKTGHIEFRVFSNLHQRPIIHSPKMDLTPIQERMMATQPDMILQYAQFLKQKFKSEYGENLAIYADSFVSLNGRPSQRFVNPEINLCNIQPSMPVHQWILAPEF